MKKGVLLRCVILAVMAGVSIVCVEMWQKKMALEERKREAAIAHTVDRLNNGIEAVVWGKQLWGWGEPDIVWMDCGEDRRIILKNKAVKSCVYWHLKKEEDSPLYESELEGWEGQMDVGWYYMNGPTIHNGEELDFYITYFKEGALDGSGLVLGEDINEWTEEQLQELKYVEGEVNINGTGETLPIKIFGYLTGAEELILDGTGVSGEFAADRGFPENIRKVTLFHYTPDKYGNLLEGIRHARVELIVTEEVDLLPLLEREEADLRIRFCQETAEHEDEEFYPGGGKVICPELDEALGWKEKDEGEENFLAIYQRCTDAGRVIECFSIRRESKQEESRDNMENVRIFLRVKDGEAVTVLIPQYEEEILGGFGDFRIDYCSMKDINFDGIKDITLDAGRYGAQGIFYEYGWIWDEERQEYAACDSYREIANPSVDEENRLVRSTWRNWAASHSWEIYRYVDGEFVPISVLTESLVVSDEVLAEMEVPEDTEVWEYEERIYYDGEWEEVQRFMVAGGQEGKKEYPKAYYKFWEPDSYFGNRH